MSLLRFFLSYNRIPLILFTLFGFFFNLFYNTNILGIKENIHLVKRLDPFDKHGHVSKPWFHNTMTLVNCFLGLSMGVFHSMAMSSILFNAKYRVVSVLVHLLRIRNLICPLITIFVELALLHHHPTNLSGLQSKILHQSNAQLVPTILYGLAAIMLYATYDRYLMEIRLIFDYLTLSLRCTRGLSPLEEQTYICEAINLHACRETMVLEQREKADRDLKEMMRKEMDRIRREKMERTRVDEQRISRIKYDNHIFPQILSFLRTVFGLQKLTVDEDNIPPSIRTGMEKQKDELRICAAKTMCCNIQKHLKDKGSILPNCLQGISRGKINLCELKEKDLCTKNLCGKNRGQSPMQAKPAPMSCSFKPAASSTLKKEDVGVSNCMAECKRQTDDRNAKKKEQERERKEQEKSDREMRARQLKLEKEERKRRQKEEEVEDNDGGVSIFNELPRTDLVMNCEIKRVLDPDCQEVLRCKEVIIPAPLCSGDKGAAMKMGGAKRSPSGPRAGGSPVGQPFGTATNCSNLGMAQRLQPIYQCANSGMNSSDSGTTTTGTGSCSTTTANPGQMCTAKGRQMDGMYSSVGPQSSAASSVQMAFCGMKPQQSQDQQSSSSTCGVNGCPFVTGQGSGGGSGMNQCKSDTCTRFFNNQQSMPYSSTAMGQSNSNASMGPAYVTARSQPANKTSVQAIPVQVTLMESSMNENMGQSFGNSGNMDSYRTLPVMHSSAMGLPPMVNPMDSRFLNSNNSMGSMFRTMPGQQQPSSMNSGAQSCYQTQSSVTPFPNTGAAKPLEAQTKRGGGGAGCDYCPITMPEDTAGNRQMATKLHPCIKCSSVKCSNNDNSCNTSFKPSKNNYGQQQQQCGKSMNSTGYSGSRPRNVQSCDMICQLKGGSEERKPVEVTKNNKETSMARHEEQKRDEAINCAAESPRGGQNKLTETKREVMKTVTNIDDQSGKVIRKECDTVIEEILQSSAVPGETKTMREVTVQRNTIQEANKTIREESHNTREEIINFELDDAGTVQPLAYMTDEFENRKQRLNAMRRISRGPPMERHVSEERCIYGRFKGSPDTTEVQSEAATRSRVENHRMGLRGGAEKRGQSEFTLKSCGNEEMKRTSRPHSTGTSLNERYYGRGDFSREFSAHLENSPYGEKIRELKGKLVHLSLPDEIHKTLEQIVVLQTEALMSFVPRGGLKFPQEMKSFNADLSYNALMKELKSVLKGDKGNGSTVTRALHDIDALNEEIEREVKLKVGAQQYSRSNRGTEYPNHCVFAALIRELREKIKDYEDGMVSRSDEEGETQEQRRQRIEVLRDELEKRKQMLGLASKQSSGDEEKSSVTSDRIRKMRENVDIQEREVKKAMKNKLTGNKSSLKKESRDSSKRSPSKRMEFVEQTIYMDPNGNISGTSTDNSESLHSEPPTKELKKCSRDSCKKPKTKKPRHQNVVAFSDQVEQSSGLSERTNVKQIAQSLGHLMDMMARARMAKKPRISLTIKPTRKGSLSQESDVTAVDAQSEATRKSKTPNKESAKLLGGNEPNPMPMIANSVRSKIPKTPSNMKLNRAKSFEHLTTKRLPIQKINCRLGMGSDPFKPANNMSSNGNRPAPLNLDPRTNEFIYQYLRERGRSIKSPSSVMKNNAKRRSRPL